MQTTLARIQFKKHLGQANHFLVTSLIGLHVLEHEDISVAPPELRMAWNPKDKQASIVRSRHFVLQSFLGWAVDSVDMYFGLLNRKPDYLQSPLLHSALSKADRSVSKRMSAFADHYDISAIERALVDVLITWRNNVFHELAENSLRVESERTLRDLGADIAQRYRGLDVSNLSDKAKGGVELTFKEAASLINASHNFVQELDEKIIRTCDFLRFCKEAMQDTLVKRRRDFRAKFAGLSERRRRGFLKTLFMNEYGFSEMDDTYISACTEVIENS